MGVVFSGVQPLKFTLRKDTSAHLRSDIDAALLALGWTHDSIISNGIIYNILSNQGYTAKVRIQDTGSTINSIHTVEVQFKSSDGLRVGYLHKLVYNWTGFTDYTMVVGPCEFFIGATGVTTMTSIPGNDDSGQNSVAGGIPFVPQNTGDCAVGGATAVTEVWWSAGPNSPHTNFFYLRDSRYCQHGYSVCYNGVLFVSTTIESYPDSPLQYAVQAPTNNVDALFHTAETAIKYGSDEPMIIDALLIFRFTVIGVIWDAFVLSKSTAVDDVITTTETNLIGDTYTAHWIAYNFDEPAHIDGSGGGTHFGTLYLLYSAAPLIGSESNYAY
jgi:hypothetical protein